jgi:hypothetical protein
MLRLALSLSLALLACTPKDAPDTKKDDAKSDTKKDAKKDDTKKDAEPRACTEKACLDTGTIEAKFGAAGAPLGKHEFVIDVDGKAHTCSVEFTDVASTAFGECGDPTSGISLSFGPVMKGKEEQLGGVVAYTEVPVPGEFRWQLSIPGTPKAIHVVHSSAGATILDKTAELTDYKEWRPNGEGCEPVCKSARVEWKLP